MIALDVVDIELLAVLIATELEPTFLVAALVTSRLVDLGVLGQFTICFHCDRLSHRHPQMKEGEDLVSG